MHTQNEIHEPFLFRFLEGTETVNSKPRCASPERGGESNPKEEEPPKEPTRKTPHGD